MTRKTLILIRHGELPPVYKGRYIGSSDVRLSAQGIRQCRKLAPRFAELKPQKIFVSPMRRTWESALAVCPPGAELVLEPRIGEINFGDWENLTFEEIQSRTTPEVLNLWFREPEKMCFPNGGCVADYYTKVDDFLRDFFQMREASVAAVTHGGALMRILASVKNVPPARQFELLPPRGSMTVLTFQDGVLCNEE